MKPFHKPVTLILLLVVLAGMGWVMTRTSTPSGQSGCSTGAASGAT